MKKRVKVGIAKFWTGATAQELIELLAPSIAHECEFRFAGEPDLMLYGPYAGALPRGSFVRVFIGCENVRPLMNQCDWAFGVGHEETVNDPRYMRFVRWGEADHLVGRKISPAAVLREKSRFCVFLFANPVYFREAFFRELSRYKRVDSPGRSMNNMQAIDVVPGRFDWKTKVEFLRQYKFVVAFENSSFPGYNTEKLTHAVEADSVPIYWGDPQIGRSFNVRRFINAHEFCPKLRRMIPRLPYNLHSTSGNGTVGFAARIARKWNALAGRFEERVAASRGFAALVEQVIRADSDETLYLSYLKEPLLSGDRLPDESRWRERWFDILNSARQRLS